MTYIDKNHLKPVKLICNTELEVRACKEFIESYNMSGMEPFVPEQDDMKDFEPEDEFNYAVADFDNTEFMISVLERFKELGIEIKIININ
jgi:hypothetical protein